MREIKTDVLIIGGGVTGCAIARRLSGRAVSVALVEAAEDVAMGASRANSAIVHAGYDAAPGSLMAKLNVEGNALFDAWCEALEVPLKRCGSLVAAFSDAERATLEGLLARGRENGVPGLRIVSGEEARALEPALSEAVTAALYAPTGAMTCPYQLTVACCENAERNGASIYLNARVRAIAEAEDGLVVEAGDLVFRARYVVNAAGLFADRIAGMVGDHSFAIRPRKGEYMLLDHSANIMRRIVFQTPTAMGKGVLVSPTVDDNVFAGPSATDTEDREDTATTRENLEEIRKLSLKSVPALNLSAVITSFAGLRAQPSTGDFILRASEAQPRLIHAAGICSPGLTSAPAIAGYVEALLAAAGLNLPVKADFDPHRPAIRRFAEMEAGARAEAIAENPAYARVICRCETVTEAEIVEAIRRGARSLDAVKRRTRAGMGRCQGGFCAPRVMELICRETGLSMLELTKFGGASKLLVGRLKEDFQ